MPLLWPQLHDPSFRPGLRELVRLHWSANIIMLRRPRACIEFTAISLVPLAALVAWLGAAGWFDERIAGLVRPTFLVPTGLAFLALQHMAFVVAFERSYAPSFRQAMSMHGQPNCEACGHLLAGAGALCPECGAAVAPRRSCDA
jgi:hypothetical protein